MGKTGDPGCVYCGAARDDSNHIFFECERWLEERTRLEVEVGSITPSIIVPVMLRDRNAWRRVAFFVERILRTKKGIEEADPPPDFR